MADENESTENAAQTPEDAQREVPPWAQGTTLRNVERDVLIPKIMRERAKIKCKDLVDEFAACAKGRTVSVLWNCMGKNDAMKKCLVKYYKDADFYDECKEMYLERRDEFQQVWVETGKTKMPKKKTSAFF